MPTKKSNVAFIKNLARLEVNLYLLLEETNKGFNEAIKNSQETTKQLRFENCVRAYATIMELILHNREKKTSSNLLETYYLEAWFGKLQSEQNDLIQNPLQEETILTNNKKIEEIKRSLDHLYVQAKSLKKLLTNQKNTTAFKKDYKDLFEKISDCSLDWNKLISERKAIYHYNFAENLIVLTEKNNSTYKNSIELLEKVIHYLTLAADFYSSADQVGEKKLTDDRKKIIAEKLKTLKNSQLPIKKRSLPFLIKNSAVSANKKVKFEPLLPIILPNEPKINKNLSLLEEEIEILWGKTYKNLLHGISSDDSYFFSQLFFNLASKLDAPHSKASSNHTLLSKLSWLDIAKKLMSLAPNKNEIFIKEISKHIQFLSTKHAQTLKIISSQKRAAAYPSYLASESQNDLKVLFIEEIIDYYYGLDAFKLQKAGIEFLESIPALIKNSRCSIEMTLEEIEVAIQSVSQSTETLFYAKLLRELVKFYIHVPNQAWLAETFSVENNKGLLYSECLRLLTIAKRFAPDTTGNNELCNKIFSLETHLRQIASQQHLTLTALSSSPSIGFFSAATQEALPPIKCFKNTLNEHLQRINKFRRPAIPAKIIYDALLRLIQTQCIEQKNQDINSALTQTSNTCFFKVHLTSSYP